MLKVNWQETKKLLNLADKFTRTNGLLVDLGSQKFVGSVWFWSAKIRWSGLVLVRTNGPRSNQRTNRTNEPTDFKHCLNVCSKSCLKSHCKSQPSVIGRYRRMMRQEITSRNLLQSLETVLSTIVTSKR